MNHRSREAAARFAERRKREDLAPRLQAIIPSLETLSLEVNEHREAPAIGGSKHLRRVVVEHAPALFVVACGDPSCKDGGHDITPEVLRHLRQRETLFAIHDTCPGWVGSAPCGRILEVAGKATYRPEARA